MFSQFTKLKSLDLQQNDISMVEDGAFTGLTQLTTLLLQHNGLRTASEEILLPMPRLTYLRIYDNPWNCDCALDSLVRTMQLPSNRNLGNYAKCAEPLSMRGYKMKRINAELLCAADKDGEVPSRPQIKVKPEVTSICRTYMFPKPLLDCSSKGEPRACSSNISKSIKASPYLELIRTLRCSRNASHANQQDFFPPPTALTFSRF